MAETGLNNWPDPIDVKGYGAAATGFKRKLIIYFRFEIIIVNDVAVYFSEKYLQTILCSI